MLQPAYRPTEGSVCHLAVFSSRLALSSFQEAICTAGLCSRAKSTTELVETGSTCQAGIDVSMTSSSSTGQNIRSASVILWLSYMLYVFVRSYWRSAKSASI